VHADTRFDLTKIFKDSNWHIPEKWFFPVDNHFLRRTKLNGTLLTFAVTDTKDYIAKCEFVRQKHHDLEWKLSLHAAKQGYEFQNVKLTYRFDIEPIDKDLQILGNQLCRDVRFFDRRNVAYSFEPKKELNSAQLLKDRWWYSVETNFVNLPVVRLEPFDYSRLIQILEDEFVIGDFFLQLMPEMFHQSVMMRVWFNRKFDDVKELCPRDGRIADANKLPDLKRYMFKELQARTIQLFTSNIVSTYSDFSKEEQTLITQFETDALTSDSFFGFFTPTHTTRPAVYFNEAVQTVLGELEKTDISLIDVAAATTRLYDTLIGNVTTMCSYKNEASVRNFTRAVVSGLFKLHIDAMKQHESKLKDIFGAKYLPAMLRAIEFKPITTLEEYFILTLPVYCQQLEYIDAPPTTIYCEKFTEKVWDSIVQRFDHKSGQRFGSNLKNFPVHAFFVENAFILTLPNFEGSSVWNPDLFESEANPKDLVAILSKIYKSAFSLIDAFVRDKDIPYVFIPYFGVDETVQPWVNALEISETYRAGRVRLLNELPGLPAPVEPKQGDVVIRLCDLRRIPGELRVKYACNPFLNPKMVNSIVETHVEPDTVFRNFDKSDFEIIDATPYDPVFRPVHLLDDTEALQPYSEATPHGEAPPITTFFPQDEKAYAVLKKRLLEAYDKSVWPYLELKRTQTMTLESQKLTPPIDALIFEGKFTDLWTAVSEPYGGASTFIYSWTEELKGELEEHRPTLKPNAYHPMQQLKRVAMLNELYNMNKQAVLNYFFKDGGTKKDIRRLVLLHTDKLPYHTSEPDDNQVLKDYFETILHFVDGLSLEEPLDDEVAEVREQREAELREARAFHPTTDLAEEDVAAVFCHLDAVYRIYRRVFFMDESTVFDPEDLKTCREVTVQRGHIDTLLEDIKNLQGYPACEYQWYCGVDIETRKTTEEIFTENCCQLQQLLRQPVFPPSKPYKPLTESDFYYREHLKLKLFRHRISAQASDSGIGTFDLSKVASLGRFFTLEELASCFNFAEPLSPHLSAVVASCLNRTFLQAPSTVVLYVKHPEERHESALTKLDKFFLIAQHIDQEEIVTLQRHVDGAETLADVKDAREQLLKLYQRGLTNLFPDWVKTLALKRNAFVTSTFESIRDSELETLSELLVECSDRTTATLAEKTKTDLTAETKAFEDLCARINTHYQTTIAQLTTKRKQLDAELAAKSKEAEKFAKDIARISAGKERAIASLTTKLKAAKASAGLNASQLASLEQKYQAEVEALRKSERAALAAATAESQMKQNAVDELTILQEKLDERDRVVDSKTAEIQTKDAELNRLQTEHGREIDDARAMLREKETELTALDTQLKESIAAQAEKASAEERLVRERDTLAAETAGLRSQVDAMTATAGLQDAKLIQLQSTKEEELRALETKLQKSTEQHQEAFDRSKAEKAAADEKRQRLVQERDALAAQMMDLRSHLVDITTKADIEALALKQQKNNLETELAKTKRDFTKLSKAQQKYAEEHERQRALQAEVVKSLELQNQTFLAQLKENDATTSSLLTKHAEAIKELNSVHTTRVQQLTEAFETAKKEKEDVITAERAAKETATAEHDKAIRELNARHTTQLTELETTRAAELEKSIHEKDVAIRRLNDENAAKLARLDAEHKRALATNSDETATLEAAHTKNLQRLQAAHAAQLEEVEARERTAVAAIQTSAEKAVFDANAQAVEELDALRATFSRETEATKAGHETAITELEARHNAQIAMAKTQLYQEKEKLQRIQQELAVKEQELTTARTQAERDILELQRKFAEGQLGSEAEYQTRVALIEREKQELIEKSTQELQKRFDAELQAERADFKQRLELQIRRETEDRTRFSTALLADAAAKVAHANQAKHEAIARIQEEAKEKEGLAREASAAALAAAQSMNDEAVRTAKAAETKAMEERDAAVAASNASLAEVDAIQTELVAATTKAQAVVETKTREVAAATAALEAARSELTKQVTELKAEFEKRKREDEEAAKTEKQLLATSLTETHKADLAAAKAANDAIVAASQKDAETKIAQAEASVKQFEAQIAHAQRELATSKEEADAARAAAIAELTAKHEAVLVAAAAAQAEAVAAEKEKVEAEKVAFEQSEKAKLDAIIAATTREAEQRVAQAQEAAAANIAAAQLLNEAAVTQATSEGQRVVAEAKAELAVVQSKNQALVADAHKAQEAREGALAEVGRLAEQLQRAKEASRTELAVAQADAERRLQEAETRLQNDYNARLDAIVVQHVNQFQEQIQKERLATAQNHSAEITTLAEHRAREIEAAKAEGAAALALATVAHETSIAAIIQEKDALQARLAVFTAIAPLGSPRKLADLKSLVVQSKAVAQATDALTAQLNPQSHQSFALAVRRSDELQTKLSTELDTLKRNQLAENKWLAQTIKLSCAPDAVKRLNAAHEVEKVALFAQQEAETMMENANFQEAMEKSIVYGGDYFRLVFGKQTPQPDYWFPEARVKLSTGVVETSSYIHPTNFQAFYTYFLLHPTLK
jgi:hypothetical protein